MRHCRFKAVLVVNLTPYVQELALAASCLYLLCYAPSPPRWRFPEFKQVSHTENTFDSVSELAFIQVIVCVLGPVGGLSKFNPNIARLLVAGRSLGREGRQSIIMSKLCARSNVMSWKSYFGRIYFTIIIDQLILTTNELSTN